MVQKKINLKNLLLSNVNFKGKKGLSESKFNLFLKKFNKIYKNRFTIYFYIFLNNLVSIFNFQKNIKNFLSFEHRINYTLKYFVKVNKLNFIYNKKTNMLNKVLNYRKILLFYRW